MTSCDEANSQYLLITFTVISRIHQNVFRVRFICNKSSRRRKTIVTDFSDYPGVGLSTGSDSELITQCLSMPPPNHLRRTPNDMDKENDKSATTVIISSGGNKRNKKISVSRKIGNSEEEILSRLKHFASLTPLSYSLIVMYNECLYGLRDPFGNRPLCIGKLVPPSDQSKLGQDNSQEVEGRLQRYLLLC